MLPATWSRANPIDIIGDASAERYTAALQAVLGAPEVDALLVLNCPTAVTSPDEAASAVLAALIFARGLDHLDRTIVEVGEADPTARLNILAANGSRLLATTWGETLSVLNLGTGVVLASEPYDDHPGWRDIPDRHLVDVRRGEGRHVSGRLGRDARPAPDSAPVAVTPAV